MTVIFISVLNTLSGRKITQELVGRKIEIRLKLKQTELWCFEGTIVELKEESDGKEQKLSLRSEHAVARVHWDECFDMHDSDHALAPRRYMQEKVHGGWNLLTAAYVHINRSYNSKQSKSKSTRHEAACQVGVSRCTSRSRMIVAAATLIYT